MLIFVNCFGQNLSLYCRNYKYNSVVIQKSYKGCTVLEYNEYLKIKQFELENSGKIVLFINFVRESIYTKYLYILYV